MKTNVNVLDQIFSPRRVAVIGASNDTTKYGGIFLETLKEFGYSGKIFPINPKEASIQGLKSWPEIASHPDHIGIEKGKSEARRYYTERGIACFEIGNQAFSVLGRVRDYYRRRAHRDSA